MDCEKCISVSITNYKAALASKHRTIVLLFVLLIVQFFGFLTYFVVDQVIDSQERAHTIDSTTTTQTVLFDDAGNDGVIYGADPG